MTKTKEELEDLKAQWKVDPCWDIEDTEGFESYAQELKNFRLHYEFEQDRIERNRVANKAQDLGCSIALVNYIERLEAKIDKLEGE